MNELKALRIKLGDKTFKFLISMKYKEGFENVLDDYFDNGNEEEFAEVFQDYII